MGQVLGCRTSHVGTYQQAQPLAGLRQRSCTITKTALGNDEEQECIVQTLQER
jgi:hypothetical protein